MGFDQNLVNVTKAAIQKGFYHLDCAEMYGTEEEVGIAAKEAGVPREKLFITNKVAQGIDDIPAALEQSLEKLQTKYFDLFVPCSARRMDLSSTANATQKVSGSYSVFR